MFKLESYITPWLLGYLDQYVNLRPEDLQLSLWGGDAVLHNLDLRLDMLQQAMHLPIVFKSGHIHELRLHVPWTKLGSEPMVITINTVECIVKVRDSAGSDSASTTSAKSAVTSRSRRRLKRQVADDLPPGYLQSILNRVVNNVTFIINNLILKFVEDDIVLSVNVKSAECYSCDGNWNRAFVDISHQDLTLRRIMNFCDLTVCLDKTNSDGHIENYQEPVLYRCFIACRVHMTYDNVNAKVACQTKVNMMCDKLEGLLSDTQLPMFLRLIELCLALYYGYLDDDKGKGTVSENNADISNMEEVGKDESAEDEGKDSEGWASWMWSMVPQILPDEGDEDGTNTTFQLQQPPVLSLAFYFNQISLTYKLTVPSSQERSHVRGEKLSVHPFLMLEVRGIGLEILLQGLTFFNVQFGIQHVSLQSRGQCICGQPADSALQCTMLECGLHSQEGMLNYNLGSLFDTLCDENRGIKGQYVLASEEHMQHFTEEYCQQRFAAFFMDYLTTLCLPSAPASGSQSSDSEETAIFLPESTMCRFVFGPSQININSSSVHRIHKLICCANNHHYEPYKRSETDAGDRVKATEEQLLELEKCIPMVTYCVTLLRPNVLFPPACHPHCHVPSTGYRPHNHRHKSKSPKGGQNKGVEAEVELCMSAERIDIQLASAMYPGRLIKLVTNVAGPSSNLMYHCHSHTQFKVFFLQAGLQQPAPKDGKKSRPIILLPPCNAAVYFRTLLLPQCWTNSYLALREQNIEIPQASVTVSKASLEATVRLLATWTQAGQDPTSLQSSSLISDLFPIQGQEPVALSVVELTVSGIYIHNCCTKLVQACTGRVSTLHLQLYTPGEGEAALTVAILYGPVDSSSIQKMANVDNQLVSCVSDNIDCVVFTVQLPNHISVIQAPAVLVASLQGVGVCADPAFLSWFSYNPRKVRPNQYKHDISSTPVDIPLAQATSPLETGESNVSVRSGSSHTPHTSSRLFSLSRAPSHTVSVVEDLCERDKTDVRQAPDANNFTTQLIALFPLLRMLHMQVDVKSSCLFVPSASLAVLEGSSDTASNVHCAWLEGTNGDIVVVCLPALSIHSVATSPMDAEQELPITSLNGALFSEKLPWTVELSDWSAFTLHAARQWSPLLNGLGVKSTWGATAHYNPPTSDDIQSLAVCLHLDMHPPTISLSQLQVKVLHTALNLAMAFIQNSVQLVGQCHSQLMPHASPHLAAVSGDEDSGLRLKYPNSRVHGTSPTRTTEGTGEALTTDLSDETSQQHSPQRGLLDVDVGSTAKLSVWLQCVLPRIALTLVTSDRPAEVCLVVEDVALSCDMQQVYWKVKSTVGSITVHNFTYSENGQRLPDSKFPVLLSTSCQLPQDAYIHTNKTWISDRSTSRPLFASPQPCAGDQLRGFFSLTYTCAQSRNVRQKMKNFIIEPTGAGERENCQSDAYFYFEDFVSEVCIKVEPMDVVLHLPVVHSLLAMLPDKELHSSHSGDSRVSSFVNSTGVATKMHSHPSASYTLPLLHVDMGAVRVFVPELCTNSARNEEKVSVCSTLNHDFLLLHLSSVHVQPQADNPLARYPVNRDLYQQALLAGMTRQMGSCVQDKQIQVTVTGLALSSGLWSNVLEVQREKDHQSKQMTPGVQIPAVEWNNYLGQRVRVKDVELFPLICGFDVCLVVAPPIVFTPRHTNQAVVMCGLAAELNVTSDLDINLSAQQLHLVASLVDRGQTITRSYSNSTGIEKGPAGGSFMSRDSGITSEASFSTAVCDNVSSKIELLHHANMLLTAGRISVTIYSHVQLAATETSAVNSASFKCGEEKAGGTMKCAHDVDNFDWLTKGMPVKGPREEDQRLAEYGLLTLMQARASQDSTIVQPASSGVCVQPLVYLYISQPHTVISTWPHRDKLELSFYDVAVKGAPQHYRFSVSKQRVMPDHADFSVHWLETRAGQVDIKTGIPPSLLTLTLSSFLLGPATIDVKLERPLSIALSTDALFEVTNFMQGVFPPRSPTTFENQSADTSQHKSTGERPRPADPSFPGLKNRVSRICLQSEQVVVSFECHHSGTSSKLVAGTSGVHINLQAVQGADAEFQAKGSVCVKDVMLKTVYRNTGRRLAGPINFDVSALLDWPALLDRPALLDHRATKLWTGTRALVTLETGLLLLHLGHHHCLCLYHWLEGVMPRHKPEGPVTGQKEEVNTAGETTPHVQLQIIKPSTDDLRSGEFVFADAGDEGELPAVGQAIVSTGETDHSVDSMLTWAYTEARVITSLTTQPVPLALQGVHVSQAAHTVECVLQYWDPCVESFITYVTFSVRDDTGCAAGLPLVQLDNVVNLAVSCIWRVVVVTPAYAQPSPPLAQHQKGRGLECALAAQLAGSMCVNSVCVPSLVPALQLLVTVPAVSLHLYNHFSSAGPVLSDELDGYTVGQSPEHDQEWAVVSLDKLSVLSRFVNQPLSQSYFQVSCNCGVDVVDYSTLTLQSVLDPVDFSVMLRLQQFQQPKAVECDVRSSSVQVHVNRSTLYTISSSLTAWTQCESECGHGPVLMGHMIICNNTYNTIHLGQVNTDENLVLYSGQMMDYSWRSCTSSQLLRICLDHPTRRWCAPIDVSSIGQLVRVVRSKDQCYTLIVQVKSLSSVLSKVTVSGHFLVRSHLSQAIEVCLHSRSGQQEESVCLVEAGKCSRAFVVEHEDIGGISIRLAGYQMPWSAPVLLDGHAVHTSQLLKTLLPDGVSFFHLWCRVLCQSVGETRQKLIVLSPLYVLRSHLPLPLYVTVNTSHSDQTQCLRVAGQGQQYQLHCTGGDVVHHLSFRLGLELPESSPAVALSSGLVDQVQHLGVDQVDIETLCHQHPVASPLQWPYTGLEDRRALDTVDWRCVDQCSVDVSVQLSQYVAGCSTLLVDISPWCLLTSLCPLPLRLHIGSQSISLMQGAVIAPPPFKELSLSCDDCDNEVWKTCCVLLSDDEAEQHRYSSATGTLLFLDGHVHCQLLSSSSPDTSSQVVPLSVISSVHQGIRIITISERLRLVNMCRWSLESKLLAVASSATQLSSTVSHAHSFTITDCSNQLRAQPLLHWDLLHSLCSESLPPNLVFYMVFSHRASSQRTSNPNWTVPVRIVSRQEGWRSTVAFTSVDGQPRSLCVTCTDHGPHVYVTVSEDNSPMCCLHNLCPFTVQFGQALHEHSFQEKTVVEEAELLPSIPSVSSGTHCLYTMPVVNSRFPAVDPGSLPFLHIRSQLSGQDRWSAWSSAIPVDSGDHFVQLASVGTIKVSQNEVAMVRHITLSVLNKAEVLAKEVYSRIPGKSAVITAVQKGPTDSVSPGLLHVPETPIPGRGAAAAVTAVKVGVKVDKVLISLEASSMNTAINQLLQVELQHVFAACYPVGSVGSTASLCLSLCSGSLRVDNPQAYQGLYDFAVILRPQQMRTLTWPHRDDMDLSQYHAVMREDSFLHLQVVVSKDPSLPNAWFLHSIEGAVRPTELCLEDSYLYFLQQELLRLVPKTSYRKEPESTVPALVLQKVYLHQQPLRIQHLTIQPISVQLSVHACLKLFLSTDHAPLSLTRFERHNLFTGTQQLAYTMALHYITAAIFRAGLVVGSLDILGSPTGLVRSVSTGLVDLLRLPYRGLTHSPSAFLTGIYGGFSSLLRNVTAGFVTSVTNFAWSVSRNMDQLSMDSDHQQRQDENRRRKPTGVSSGLQQGLTGFGLSLLGAVAGLVDQPLQSVLAQQSPGQATSRSRAAGGFMVGIGKGLVGVITKPIGGAAELVAQTGHGLLHGSGLQHQVSPLLQCTGMSHRHPPMSWFKYQVKLLPDTPLLCAVAAVREDCEEGEGEVVVLLTGELVMVVSQRQDAQQQAFAVTQLSCLSPAPAIITLTLHDHHSQTGDHFNATDRVAAFISSTRVHSQALAELQDVSSAKSQLLSRRTNDDDTRTVQPLSYSFRADPYWVQLFVALFNITRRQCAGKGFSL